jgi:hypothetical protein
MSLDWTSSTDTRDQPNYPDLPWDQRPGEVFGEPRAYSPAPTPIGLDYSHVCGEPSEFIDGAGFDPFREVEYDEQGLPLCCHGPIVPVFPLVVGFDAFLQEALNPGNSCATAQPLTLGVWYDFFLPAVLPYAAYFCWPDLLIAGDYRLRVEWLVPGVGLWNYRFLHDPGCSPFVPPVEGVQEINMDQTQAMAAGDTLTLLFSTPSIISGSFIRFRVDLVSLPGAHGEGESTRPHSRPERRTARHCNHSGATAMNRVESELTHDQKHARAHVLARLEQLVAELQLLRADLEENDFVQIVQRTHYCTLQVNGIRENAKWLCDDLAGVHARDGKNLFTDAPLADSVEVRRVEGQG